MESNGKLHDIARLADVYLAGLRAFGCFCEATDLRQRLEGGHIAERVGFIGAFFQALQHFDGLHFVDGEVPLLYDTQTWPDGLEPGGYVSTVSPLLPSDHVKSIFMTWSFQATMVEKDSSPVRRFLKAALWVTHQNGPSAALRYLFALHERGLLIDPSALWATADSLMRAARMVAADADICTLFFGARPPQTPREMIDAEFVDVDLEGPLVRLPHALVQTAIAIATEQVERVRDAPDYDEWLRGQFVLHAQLNAVKQLVRDHVPSVGITLQSVLDHFEEMRADAGGLVRTISSGLTSVAFKSMFGDAEGRARLPWAAAVLKDNNRLLAERALVPRRISHIVLDPAGPPLPDEWRRLSPMVGWALSMAQQHPEWLLDSSRAFSVDQILDSPAADRAFAGAGVEDDDARRVLAMVCAGVLEAHSNEKLRRELARLTVSDEAASPAEASSDHGEDEELNAIQAWVDANRDAVREIVGQVRLALRGEDIVARTKLAMTQSKADPAAAISTLEALVADYPWVSTAHAELGIARDKAGRPEDAIAPLANAVAVEPENPLHWQSLSVVLRRSNSDQDAKVALAVIALLRSIPRLAADPKLAGFWRTWDARWA